MKILFFIFLLKFFVKGYSFPLRSRKLLEKFKKINIIVKLKGGSLWANFKRSNI